MMASTTSLASLRITVRSAVIAIATLVTLAVASPAYAKKVGNATVPDSLNISGAELPLRGAGLRTRAVFKLYAAALYTDESGDGNAVTAADKPMGIHLHILSKLVTKDKLVEALNDGFKASTGGDMSSVQGGVDAMIAAMDKPVKRGVTYTLAYEPGVGTTMTRNGEDPVIIEGLEFKQALFGIWLGDKPVQGKLKNGMLGS